MSNFDTWGWWDGEVDQGGVSFVEVEVHNGNVLVTLGQYDWELIGEVALPTHVAYEVANKILEAVRAIDE